ncbi:MAG: hypothetical protein H7838_09665 [Magnetococcus sp. DMHC-8]
MHHPAIPPGRYMPTRNRSAQPAGGLLDPPGSYNLLCKHEMTVPSPAALPTR